MHRLVVASAVLLGLIVTPLAAAQEDDPYGSTTTTRPPQAEQPKCRVETPQVRPGDTARVQVLKVQRGRVVRLYFDGELVDTDTATGKPNQSYVTVPMSFIVPPREPGRYRVHAVVSNFTAECRAGNKSGIQVLSASGVQGSERSRGLGGLDVLPGSGVLPRTGVDLLLMLLAAAALVVGGRAIVLEARRRRLAARSATGHRVRV